MRGTSPLVTVGEGYRVRNRDEGTSDTRGLLLLLLILRGVTGVGDRGLVYILSTTYLETT